MMVNPDTVLDDKGEWFEIYNTTTQSLNLNGLTIVDDADDSFIIEVDLQISSNGYLTLGINADPTTNGGVDVDYQYSNFRLNNTTDSITLINPEGSGDQIVDSVDYDATTFPSTSGESVSLIQIQPMHQIMTCRFLVWRKK